MVLNIVGRDYAYELEKLSSAFFPEEHIYVIINGKLKDGSEPDSEVIDNDKTFITVDSSDINCISVTSGDISLSDSGQFNLESLASSKDSLELHCAELLYKLLCKITGLDLGWGILTGIRPSKLLIRLMNEKGREEGIEYFRDAFLVSEKKTELALSVADAEREIMESSTDDAFSLYVSIPFCPTRCSYCSFVSSAVSKTSAKKIIEPYFDNLIREIEYTADIADKTNLKMLSAYIGGGTPSTLSSEQITVLLDTINSRFDMSRCSEFTFEAGRPDTITRDKLEAILRGGVDRISINPQTMSDEVLSAVGRMHTAADVIDIYDTARNVGFTNINMDLIAGLPGDTLEGFCNSLDRVIELGPECITIHALAYKRSSDLSYEDGLFSATRNTSHMIDYANETLYKYGYKPYYMYRQAKSVGNLENVGWCKDGYLSKYNIYMMEECHTILSCGAGAVTKLRDPKSGNIDRIFNFKYPYEYNDRFIEQIERKKAVLDFYGRH